MLKKRVIGGILLLLLLACATTGWAAKGMGKGKSTSSPEATPCSETDGSAEESDRPDYAQTPGKANKPGGGNASSGTSKGQLYGDLYIIVRDENGAPILYEWVWIDGVPVSYHPSPTGFPQPLAAAGSLPQFADFVPVDEEGAIPDAYAAYAQEVEFGRLNLARSPQSVRDRAYEEAIKNLNGADQVRLDPAGRLLLINDGKEKAVDSPRENLALYQKLLQTGHLNGLTRTDLGPLSHLLATDPAMAEVPDQDDLQQAAAFLAAAADKTGEINIDKVVYLNSLLGINGVDTKTYYDFSRFQYQRQLRHGQTRAEVLIGPDRNQGAPQERWFKVGQVQIMDVVFAGSDPGMAEKARGFAKASDDALKIIGYIHNWAVPVYEEP